MWPPPLGAVRGHLGSGDRRRRSGHQDPSGADLALVAGDMRDRGPGHHRPGQIGPAHHSAAVLPASLPHGQLSDITTAMIYGITAFAVFEAAAALGEEARNTRRRSRPALSASSS